MKDQIIIALEGIDGSGKTTQAKLLSDKLNFGNISTEYLAPSTDLPSSQYLIHLVNVAKPLDPKLFMYVYGAMVFNLESSADVIVLDRYIDTSRASSLVNGIQHSEIELAFMLHKKATITIVLKVDPEISLKRKGGVVQPIESGSSDIIAGSQFDSFSDYQKALQDKYLQFADQNPSSYIVLDGNLPIGELNEILFEKVITRLK